MDHKIMEYEKNEHQHQNYKQTNIVESYSGKSGRRRITTTKLTVGQEKRKARRRMLKG